MKSNPKKELKSAIQVALSDIMTKAEIIKPTKKALNSIDRFSKKFSKELADIIKKQNKKLPGKPKKAVKQKLAKVSAA
jgi:hypothetical protein